MIDSLYMYFTGGNPVTMHLWQENAAAPLMLTHFGYGLGSMIAPFIASPFISNTGSSNDTCTDPSENSHGFSLWQQQEQRYALPLPTFFNGEDDSRIQICHGIVGISVMVISLGHLYYVIRGPPKGFKVWKPSVTMTKIVSPASCAYGHFWYGLIILVLLCLYYAQTNGGQAAFSNFLFSFAVCSKLKFSSDDAALLNSVFFIFYTFGRLVGAFGARFISINVIILVSQLVCIFCVLLMALFAEENAILFCVLTCILGFFTSLLFPSGMAWANLHLNMNSMSVMVLLCGSSLGQIPYNYLAGFAFEEFGPNAVQWVALLGYGLSPIVFLLMYALTWYHERKYKEQRQCGEIQQVKQAAEAFFSD